MSITVGEWRILSDRYPGIVQALIFQRNRISELLIRKHEITRRDCDRITNKPFNFSDVKNIRVINDFKDILDKSIGFELDKLIPINDLCKNFELGNFFILEGKKAIKSYPVQGYPLKTYIGDNIVAFIRSEAILEETLDVIFEVSIYDISSDNLGS
jgi:hypothetical protein